MKKFALAGLLALPLLAASQQRAEAGFCLDFGWWFGFSCGEKHVGWGHPGYGDPYGGFAAPYGYDGYPVYGAPAAEPVKDKPVPAKAAVYAPPNYMPVGYSTPTASYDSYGNAIPDWNTGYYPAPIYWYGR